MTEQPTIGVDEVQAAIDMETGELRAKVNELQAAMEEFQDKHNKMALLLLDLGQTMTHNLLVHQAFQDAVSEHTNFDVEAWRARGLSR